MHCARLSPIVTTTRLAEARAFWTEQLGFRVAFEMDDHLCVRSGQAADISFMAPEDGQPTFGGAGLTCCLEVDDVDGEHARLTARGLAVTRPLQDNPWGDRSFVVVDPTGVDVYIYQTIEPTPEFAEHYRE